MKPHINRAHELWKDLVHPQDHVIDATCGNGHDTLFLAKLVPNGKVFALDLQENALAATHKRLTENGLAEFVEIYLQSHEEFPSVIEKGSITLIVYNLGYLPGGNKALTTMTNSTLKSVQNGMELLKSGGLISLTLYPGHSEGETEATALLKYVKTLSKDKWTIQHEQWGIKSTSPSLLTLRKP